MLHQRQQYKRDALIHATFVKKKMTADTCSSLYMYTSGKNTSNLYEVYENMATNLLQHYQHNVSFTTFHKSLILASNNVTFIHTRNMVLELFKLTNLFK